MKYIMFKVKNKDKKRRQSQLIFTCSKTTIETLEACISLLGPQSNMKLLY